MLTEGGSDILKSYDCVNVVPEIDRIAWGNEEQINAKCNRLPVSQAAIMKIGGIPIRMSTIYILMRAIYSDKPIPFFAGV